MTRNQIDNRKANESKRHNMKEEELEKEKNKISKANVVSNFASKLIGAINDPAWYNEDPQLVKDAASISFQTAIGNKSILDQLYFTSAVDPELEDMPDSLLVDRSYEGLALPGIYSIRWMPSIGYANGDIHSPIEAASKNIYAFVRHANSGSTNYDSPDMMLYLMACDSVYTMLSHACLVYSVALTAKTRNRYYPIGMLTALGVNQSIIDNLANYRAKLNVLITKISALNVPANWSVFKRHIWLASNIFKDTATHKSQEYVFVPDYYTYSPEMGCLVYGSLHSSIQTVKVDAATSLYGTFTTNGSGDTWLQLAQWSNLLDVIDNQISVMLADEDIGIMSGDILKAFGEEGVFKLAPIAADYHVESTYSAEVLSQINNASLPGLPVIQVATDATNPSVVPYTAADIWQDDKGVLRQGRVAIFAESSGDQPENTASGLCFEQPYYFVSSTAGYATISKLHTVGKSKHVINMYKDDVSPDDVMVATRDISTWEEQMLYGVWGTTADGEIGFNDLHETGRPTRLLTSCGTEIFMVGVIISATGRTGSTITSSYYFTPMADGYTVLPATVTAGNTYNADFSYAETVLQMFDWAPQVRLCGVYVSQDSAIVAFTQYFSTELDNFGFLQQSNINNMHSVAILSEFGVNQFGNKVRSKFTSGRNR